jgi:microcystin-dependent protein
LEAYVGEIRIFAGLFAPNNWLFCNGSQVNITDYQLLYAVLGTAWGGDGVKTFKLPNLIGRLPVGQGQGGGLTARILGQMAGADPTTLVQANLPAHTHTVNASTDPATSVQPSPAVTFARAQGSDVFYAADTTAETELDQLAVSTDGGGQPHDNTMPLQTVNYIICFNGIFPQRP